MKIIQNIAGMTTKEMLAEYNKLTGKSTTKFSSRAKGEEQLQAAREEFGAKTSHDNRSAGIAKSWKDPETAKKRSNKQNVSVTYDNGGDKDSSKFRSVKAAFEHLGLPMNKHIKFRGELKAAGKVAFEHDGNRCEFQIVKGGE